MSRRRVLPILAAALAVAMLIPLGIVAGFLVVVATASALEQLDVSPWWAGLWALAFAGACRLSLSLAGRPPRGRRGPGTP